MPLSKRQVKEIAELLTGQIRRKLADYNPEPNTMPFHTRLLGKDRMALFSFIQSINTTLGASVFEQTAVIIASPNFKRAASQYKEFNDTISREAQRLIQSLMDDLTTGRITPDKAAETKRILAIAQSGTMQKVKRPRIDLFVESHEGVEYYFDLKTAKPNVGEFKEFKRMLLEWIAIRGALDPKRKFARCLQFHITRTNLNRTNVGHCKECSTSKTKSWLPKNSGTFSEGATHTKNYWMFLNKLELLCAQRLTPNSPN